MLSQSPVIEYLNVSFISHVFSSFARFAVIKTVPRQLEAITVISLRVINVDAYFLIYGNGAVIYAVRLLPECQKVLQAVEGMTYNSRRRTQL